MARCGHTGQCNCVFEDGSGTRWSGTGTPEQPARVDVALSTDSGNCLRFDGQGRLYSPCGDGAASGCGVSVAGLPDEHLAIGRGGAGRLLAPDHTLRSYTRAIDLSLPAVHVRCRPLSDGTPVAFPALSTRNQSGQFPQHAYWPGLPSDHGDYLIPNMDLTSYQRMPIFAGWERDYQVDREVTRWNGSSSFGQPTNPILYNEENLGGRWGFFGFGERMVKGGLTLSEVLNFVALRTVVNIELATSTPLFLELVLAMIRRHCAQEAVIVSSYDAEDLQPFIDENIDTMIWLRGEGDAATNPPAQVADQGVGWVNADRSLEDGTIVGYTSQGLDVIISTLTRHYHWNRVDDLGCRGALSDDPVYMMGIDTPEAYRVASGHTSLRHHGVYPGQLTRNTDQEAYWPPWSRGEKLVGWDHNNNHTGPVALLPPLSSEDLADWSGSGLPVDQRNMHGYGITIPQTTNEEFVSPWGGIDILAGWLCPVVEPTSYAVEFQVCFCSDPGQGGRNMGLFFGLPDDRCIQDHLDAGSEFWQVTFQRNADMHLRRYIDGGIDEDNSAHDNTGETVNVGSWYRIRVVVDDVSVTAQRVEFDGTVRTELTLNGEAHGPYMAIFKNELGADGNFYLFTSGHRQLWVQSPFEGGDPGPLNDDGSYPWELAQASEDFPEAVTQSDREGAAMLPAPELRPVPGM